MDYLVFVAICIAATASPGPAVFLAIKNGAQQGLKPALVGILGNISAIFTLAVASTAGLGAIIMASATLFSMVKILGGLYLIYLGIKAWRAKPTDMGHDLPTFSQSETKWKLYKQAYLVGISNPKTIAFYTALFPQFIDTQAAIVPQFALLTGTFMLLSFGFLAVYAALASQLRGQLAKENVRQWFNRVTGGLFVGIGLMMASTQRS